MTRHACRARVLAAMPGNAKQLAQRALVHESTARTWIRSMRAEPVPACHVVKWTRTEGNTVPTYAAGPGKDAPRPKPLTPSQTSKAFRARTKKDGRAEDLRARRRARIAADKAARAGGNWLSALGVSV